MCVLAGAIRVAAPLPVVALILAVSGILMSGLGSLKRNGKTIIAAVCYILAGEVCCKYSPIALLRMSYSCTFKNKIILSLFYFLSFLFLLPFSLYFLLLLLLAFLFSSSSSSPSFSSSLSFFY